MQVQQASPKKSPLKKNENAKLSGFLQDCATVGCLRGFKYFELYLRGKEELLMRVYQDVPHAPNPTMDNQKPLGNKYFLSQRMQKVLFDSSSKMAPASPCDRELEMDETKVAFLIAGYARYERPFAWLRSNHSKLVKIASIPDLTQKDNPIKLDTVDEWLIKDVKLWEIMEEIWEKSAKIEGNNPFAINHEYLNSLSIQHSFILSGALISFLKKILSRNPVYKDEIFDDIVTLQERNIYEFTELLKKNEALV